MTNARLQVQIAESKADAELAMAKRQNDRTVMQAQTELTNTRLKIQVAECEGDAEVARARRHAEQLRVLAEAESQKSRLAGRGEAQRVLQVGLAEANVLQQKIASYGDPRLFALTLASRQLARSTQPLVPERLFVTSAAADANNPTGQGLVETLLGLLVAEKSGFSPSSDVDHPELREVVAQLSKDTLATLCEPPQP